MIHHTSATDENNAEPTRDSVPASLARAQPEAGQSDRSIIDWSPKPS
jgi:hypothetical protein